MGEKTANCHQSNDNWRPSPWLCWSLSAAWSVRSQQSTVFSLRSDWLTSQSLWRTSQSINQQFDACPTCINLQTFGGHIFAWTPFLMCFSWGPFKGWFFGDFIQTWSSRSWEFSQNLVFWALASSSIPEYLVLVVQIVVLDSVWVGFDGCFQKLLFAEILTVCNQGYAWIALMIFSTRRLHIGQFGEVFQFFLAQG